MDAFLTVEELRATAQHIELLDRKLEKLARARADSWSQMLTRAAQMFRASEIDERELIRLYNAMKGSFGSGFSRVWDQHMPIPANRVKWCRRDTPNGPMGSWVGEIPLAATDPAPPYGASVVYVLFDGLNDPVYVGSTEAFRTRLGAHQKEKPDACRWAAYPCRDRDHAYEVEDRLLKQHKPRMNKRAAR